MRPSSSLCHHLPSIELHYAIALQAATRERRVGRQPRLLDQLAQESAGVRDALPDLRQEGAAPALRLEDQPVLAGPDLGDEVGFVGEAQRPGGAKERNLERAMRPFLRGEGRKARIA